MSSSNVDRLTFGSLLLTLMFVIPCVIGGFYLGRKHWGGEPTAKETAKKAPAREPLKFRPTAEQAAKDAEKQSERWVFFYNVLIGLAVAVPVIAGGVVFWILRRPKGKKPGKHPRKKKRRRETQSSSTDMPPV
jgi:hypothetical protein